MSLAMVAAPLRVFVIDDCRDTTESFRLLLMLHGYTVATANSGSAAIEQAPGFEPDVMLVDLAMPAVDGFTVARAVRAMPNLHGISLIAVTGFTDPQHCQQALDAGFDECLFKPVPLTELLDVLGRVAANRHHSDQ